MSKCGACGTDLPPNGPAGHCPKCLIQLGLMAGAPSSRLGAKTNGEAPGAAASFGDYELIERIGRGGMGVIYKARQVSLNRPVAIKMINGGEFASATQVQRFKIEAEAAANLHHPNIVSIHEIGEHQGQFYFSMELIAGQSLDRLLKPGGFVEPGVSGGRSARARQERIVDLLMKLARAVDYAHQHGVLHRDIKPGNVLLDAQGEPHLTDFGVAKVMSQGASGLTATGAVVGTPSYMAPEQASGQSKRVTTAADIYSLGAVLYAMLTGHPPFRADTPVETLKKVVEEEPKHPSTLNEGIDRDLANICLKCMEKDPQRRYGSAGALVEDLARWLRREPILAHPTGLALRTRRWVQRNPVATALILSLCLGIAGCLTLLDLARRERISKDRALAEKDQMLAALTQGVEKQLNDLWLEEDRTAYQTISPLALAAFADREWVVMPGGTNHLTFGVYTYSKPNELLQSLAPFLVFLGNTLAQANRQRCEIELRIFRSYDSALNALVSGELQFMRMGPSSYLQLKARNPGVQLLGSQVHIQPLTLAIFTHAENAAIQSVTDLAGRSFAFGDTNSTTGHFVAKWVLFKGGLRLSDLARHVHLASQSDVKRAVLARRLDAGAANLDLVRDDSSLNVIATLSLDNLGLCWVGGPGLKTPLRDLLKDSLLSIRDPSVLEKFESRVAGFQYLPDSAYDELKRIMRQAELFSVPRR